MKTNKKLLIGWMDKDGDYLHKRSFEKGKQQANKEINKCAEANCGNKASLCFDCAKEEVKSGVEKGKQQAKKDCKLVFNTIIHKLEDNRNRYSDIIVYIKKKIAELSSKIKGKELK